MLHDYGFYKFEKFSNYIENKDDLEGTIVKPLFATRTDWLRYDDCS